MDALCNGITCINWLKKNWAKHWLKVCNGLQISSAFLELNI